MALMASGALALERAQHALVARILSNLDDARRPPSSPMTVLEPGSATLRAQTHQQIFESHQVCYEAWQRIAASHRRLVARPPIAGASQWPDNGHGDGRGVRVEALAGRLNAAALAGEPCTIVYREDGRPPTTHLVEPIAATPRILRARDAVTRQLKVFLLARLELVRDRADEIAAPPAPPPRAEQDLLAATANDLQVLGWHVVVSSRGISVYRIDSRGAPLQIAAASIVRKERRKEGPLGTSLQRPWTVAVHGTPRTRVFGTLEHAIAFFVNEARARAPRWRTMPPPAP